MRNAVQQRNTCAYFLQTVLRTKPDAALFITKAVTKRLLTKNTQDKRKP